ncbi:MAG: FAD-dependent oxidoreductase [Candidatus Binataceae bacterium]
MVVLGIPVEALKRICKKLSECDPIFDRMLNNAATTMTQAFQVWMSTDLSQLGADKLRDCTATGFVEPFDTYADMSHLIGKENWVNSVGSVGYFCNVLKDCESDTQTKANDRVKQNAVTFLRDQVQHLWSGARPKGTFDWSLLIDSSARKDDKRFESQWWIANFQPSERYTLTPAGNVANRLQTNQTRFKNLFLAGDWIRTGLDAGCIEAAALAGRQAARAIKGTDEQFPNESTDWLKEF